MNLLEQCRSQMDSRQIAAHQAAGELRDEPLTQEGFTDWMDSTLSRAQTVACWLAVIALLGLALWLSASRIDWPQLVNFASF